MSVNGAAQEACLTNKIKILSGRQLWNPTPFDFAQGRLLRKKRARDGPPGGFSLLLVSANVQLCAFGRLSRK